MTELPSRVFFRQGSAVAKPGRNHLPRAAVAPLGHPLPRSAIDNRVKGPVRRLAIFISAWLERRAELRALQCLDDQMLKDVGVSRGDIEREVRRKWYDV